MFAITRFCFSIYILPLLSGRIFFARDLSVDETLLCDLFKGIEQYFHVIPFIILYKVVLTFKSVDETRGCFN